jgi:hypothetical protein
MTVRSRVSMSAMCPPGENACLASSGELYHYDQLAPFIGDGPAQIAAAWIDFCAGTCSSFETRRVL